MKIKKTIAVLLCAAALSCTLAGCSEDSGSSSEGNASSNAQQANANAAVDVKAVADKLKNEIKFDDQLDEIDSDKISNILGVSEDKYASAKCLLCSSGATPEEIDCFEAKDEAAAGEIKAALESRLEAQKNTFKDYNAEQAPKLDEPVLVVNGKYVYLCVSGDNSKAKEIIG